METMTGLTKPQRQRLPKALRQIIEPLLPDEATLFHKIYAHPVPASYPCSGVTISLPYSLPFPPDIDDRCPEEVVTQSLGLVMLPPPRDHRQKEIELAPFVSRIDTLVRAIVEGVGGTNYRPYWDEDGWHFSIACALPPMRAGETREHHRPMTDVELNTFRKEAGREPFSDEYMIMTRYAGINVFRTFSLTAEVGLGLMGSGG